MLRQKAKNVNRLVTLHEILEGFQNIFKIDSNKSTFLQAELF